MFKDPKKILVFGGAFDPFHLGHLKVIENLLIKQMADEVWLVPAGLHPFEKKVANDQHRLKMIELGLLKLDPQLLAKVKINDNELNKKGVGFTFDTLNFFQTQYPDWTFKFVIGSDNLDSFHKWNEYQQLITKYQFLVYPRAGYDFQPWYQQMQALPDFPQIEISSTQVKQLLKNHQSIIDQVGEFIAQYINTHHLYQD